MRKGFDRFGALRLRRALVLGACLWAWCGICAYAAESQEEARGGPLVQLGTGIAAFTRDFAKTQAPGPEFELFAGHRFTDPYGRTEAFTLGLNSRYSYHAAIGGGKRASHRLVVAWEGAVGFPVARRTELGVGLQVGVVYLSHVYGAGYDQGFLAFARWRPQKDWVVELLLKADITDKKLFVKTAAVNRQAAFGETTVALGLRVGYGR